MVHGILGRKTTRTLVATGSFELTTATVNPSEELRKRIRELADESIAKHGLTNAHIISVSHQFLVDVTPQTLTLVLVIQGE